MERVALLSALKRIAPALSDKKFIPVLSCFCFEKDSVYAFDDTICFRTPLKSGIIRAIPGDMLLGFLQNSKASEVEILDGKEPGKDLIFKMGRSRLKVAGLPDEDFLFKHETENAVPLPLTDDTIACLGACMVAASDDLSEPARFGITVSLGKNIIMYSSDNVTATRAVLPEPAPKKAWDRTFVLNPKFVSILLSTHKTDQCCKLVLSTDVVEAHFTSGSVLFAKLVSGSDIVQYGNIFKHYQRDDRAINIPKTLERCLSRAAVVLESSDLTEISIQNMKMKLISRSQSGEVVDNVTLEEEHPPVKVFVNPSLIAKVIPWTTRISFGKCIILYGDSSVHLISAKAV